MIYIYDIIMVSGLYMNNTLVYKETVTQQWHVTIENEINGGLLITIEMFQPPKTNSPAIQPMYVLTDIINKAIARVRLMFDFNGNLTLENQKEISVSWDESKKEIIETFGGKNKIINRMMKDADYCFYNFNNEVNKSFLYNILLSVLRDEKKFQITTSSVLQPGHDISLTMKCTESEKMDNECVRYFQYGKSMCILFSDYESIYNKQVRPLVGGAQFDYKYTFDTEYIFGHKKMFDKAIATITEQASKNYIYTNLVEFKLMEG